MTIDTTDPPVTPPTNTPILEQIEKFPQGENIEGIRNSVKLSFHAKRLAEQEAEVEKVNATSEIKEDRTFSKEDITKLIVLFAIAHKLELDNLKVSEIIRDRQGTLIVLEVKYPNPDGGHQLINYTIKGQHEHYYSQTTSLDRTFWDKDDIPEGGDIIAEYLEGKWQFKD